MSFYWIIVFASFILTASGLEDDSEEILDLFEGDIVLPPKTGFRSVINEKHRLWPNGEVHYKIVDPKYQITAAQRRNISIAIQNFQAKTCLKFFEKRDHDGSNFIMFKYGSGCSSNVGMVGGSRGGIGQTITLGGECFRVGKIMHEIMHSLGFFHEQSRFDRDQYVRIIPQNIRQGSLSQFRLHDLSKQNKDLGAPYDYGSLMHYSSHAFSHDSDKFKTIVPIYEGEIGQRVSLSDIDVWKINKLYNCPNIGPVPKVDYKEVEEVDVKLVPAQRDFSCSFRYNSACGMRDEIDNEFDWQVGEDDSRFFFETGPKATSEGEKCCYIFMVSAGRIAGQKGTIVTPPLEKTDEQGACLTFYYHMYGSTVGTLDVFWRALNTDQHNQILTENGDHGDKWIKKSVIVKSNEDIEVVFRGTIGGDEDFSLEGNIAVEKIEYMPMRILPLYGRTCDV